MARSVDSFLGNQRVLSSLLSPLPCYFNGKINATKHGSRLPFVWRILTRLRGKVLRLIRSKTGLLNKTGRQLEFVGSREEHRTRVGEPRRLDEIELPRIMNVEIWRDPTSAILLVLSLSPLRPVQKEIHQLRESRTQEKPP